MGEKIVMLIGVDASRAVISLRTGTENYSWEIIKRLAAQSHPHQLRLYTPSLPKEELKLSPHVEWRVLPQKRLWSQLRLAAEVYQHPPDILFIPAHVIPLLTQVATVVTIHDLAYLYFPDSYPLLNRLYLHLTTQISARKARRIIVPSRATRDSLIKEYRINPAKIVVIPHGYNREIFKPSVLTDRPPIDPPYIFYVGRIEEKKNLRLLIQAFSLFAKEKTTVKLVLAGRQGYGYERIRDTIVGLPDQIKSRIFSPGFLPQYDMVRYLSRASLLALPSWYEGFGLPVLEAMAVGTPVVCSDIPALAELAADAAILLPPTNPLAWAAAFSRIVNKPSLAQELKALGLARAHQYSWEKAAQQTLATLIDVNKTA